MTPAEIASLLRTRMDLETTAHEAEGLALYLDVLLRWNARTNLTAIREPEAVVLRHFGESLVCARALGAEPGASLLDYGSGAGFPGLVCALARPDLRMTLAESQGKKAAFLREAARVLRLTPEVHGGRVAELAEGLRFDRVTLRAVDSMEAACIEAAGRLAVGGRMFLLTTRSAAESLRAALSKLEWETGREVPGSRDRVLLVGNTSS